MGDTENKELKALQEEERKRVEAEAEAAAAARAAADAKELEDLQASHAAQTEALSSYNNAQYANMGQIMSDLQSKVDAATQKDEKARKRENAFRYISGLGDTLSSFANLVGVTKGAANQQQKYNSHAVVEKAEAARKARKLEIDDLGKRLDEMKARQKELKAAGSLKEAELAAANAKEVAALAKAQRAAEETEKKFYATKTDNAVDTATSRFVADRNYKTQQEQWQKNYNLQLSKFNEEQKGNKYNFTFSDGSIDIPKEKINEANIERIYQMLPEEIRKTIKGEQFIDYSTDEYGTQTRTTAYKAPTITQKIAAIAAFAENDVKIKDELRRLAGMKVQVGATPEVEARPSSGRDWSARKDTTSSKPSLSPQKTEADTLEEIEKEILKGDSVYINGNRYAKL